MKKHFFFLLCALVASTSVSLAWDYERVQIGDLYYNLDTVSRVAEVTSSENNYEGLSDIDIPASVSYNDTLYNVTSIGQEAFNSCQDLISVTIPESVTSIGWTAFASCRNLITADLPSSVVGIGVGAFQGCSSLTSVTIPSKLVSIEEYAFSGCDGLVSISVDAENTVFDSRDNCNAVISTSDNMIVVGCQNTVIPSSVTRIGLLAFCQCYSLTSIVIPSSVTIIDYNAFASCSGLRSITCEATTPPSLERAFDEVDKSIPVYVPEGSIEAYQTADEWSEFTNIQAIASGLDEPYTGKVEIDGLYYNLDGETLTAEVTRSDKIYEGLSNVDIPASVSYNDTQYSVTSIGIHAFSGCSSLISIVIPNSVISIANETFFNCSSLTSVTIPSSVTRIGQYAFGSCTSLTIISVEAGNMVYDSRDNCNAIINTASNTLVVGCSNTVIPNSVTSIGSSSFSSCRSLTSINIPSSVTSIGYGAFSGCTSLTSVNIPSSVTSIGEAVFNGCTSLTSINIPNSITSIDNLTFYGCIGLTSVTIPNSVTSIGEKAFHNCRSLTSIEIPSSVTNIGGEAFFYCSGLTSIICKAATPPSLGDFALEGVDKSIPVYVPEESVELYRRAQGWNEFTNISAYVPSTVTIFGENVVITDPSDSTVVMDEVDILGDSTLVYSPEDNTLTITNAQLEAGDSISAAISYTGSDPLTIVLCDSSTIIADTIISSTSDIIITGSGTLIAEGVVPIIGTEDATITFDSVNMVVQSLPSPAAVRHRIRGGKRLDETGGPALSGFGNVDFNKVEVTPPAAMYGVVTPDDSPSLTDAIRALYVPNADGSKLVLTGFTLRAIADDHSAVEMLTQTPVTKCTKIILGGQLLIQRGDRTYTLQGIVVR